MRSSDDDAPSQKCVPPSEHPFDEVAIEATLVAELRSLAAAMLRQERPNHTLQPTALVNEVFLRMVEQWPEHPRDPVRFRALAALAMRRILVDHARRAGSQRHGSLRRVTLTNLDAAIAARGEGISVDVLALDDALRALGARSGRQARIVELRWFGGLNIEEIAGIVGVGSRTVKADWRIAKAWLHRELSREFES